MLSSCDEYHMQCYDSLRDPVERANYKCSLAIGPLKGCIRLGSRHTKGKMTNFSLDIRRWQFVG